MQIPFEHGDKMEVCLFEKKEPFFVTNITEYRDGAGFLFKTIEIGRTVKQKPLFVPGQKQNPAFPENMKQLPPQKPQIKSPASAGTNRPAVSTAQRKTISGSSAKQISGNTDKKLAAKDAVYLPAGKKK